MIEYIRYTIPTEDADKFHDTYAQAGKYLTNDPHCVEWELRQSVETPAHHVVRITWDSQEGHEVGFRSTPEYEEFRAMLAPFRGYIEEMAHYDTLESASSQ